MIGTFSEVSDRPGMHSRGRYTRHKGGSVTVQSAPGLAVPAIYPVDKSKPAKDKKKRKKGHSDETIENDRHKET